MQQELARWQERLVADGFVLLRAFCARDFVARVAAIARHRADEVLAALGDREIGIGSAAGYAELVQRSPGRWDVPVTPAEFGIDDHELPWWPLVAAVLGSDAEHSFSGVVFSDPGSPAQCWHIDSPHLAGEHLPPHALNVLVALHDIPLEMGPTECARGSHRLTNHLRNSSLVRNELIYQTERTSPALLVAATDEPLPPRSVEPMAAGSCLVFDDRLLHRGLANRSAQTRHVAYFSYRRNGYGENTHFESARSLFDG
ncbi:MAG: phytanoyl-CoA dioxygenase family protein [Woeseiaceae bacterium]|nr:phytanoyl-CoA dioxygenase family protein [Woeseiaceae bacterium]